MNLLDKNNDKYNNYLRKIIKLGNKFEYLFDYNVNKNNIENPIKIKYKFCKEYELGFIEYKRTLSTYSNKKGKLLRQIYWRLHEYYTDSSIESSPIESLNLLKCYYVIGLEDDGSSSNLSLNELDKSLNIILQAISDTNINKSYLYLFNEINKSYLLLIRLELDINNTDFDYF